MYPDRVQTKVPVALTEVSRGFTQYSDEVQYRTFEQATANFYTLFMNFSSSSKLISCPVMLVYAVETKTLNNPRTDVSKKGFIFRASVWNTEIIRFMVYVTTVSYLVLAIRS